MTPTQIVSIATPLAVGAASMLVHFLAPATVSEIGIVLGMVVTMLTAVRNVFVVSPSTTKALANGSLRPGPMVGGSGIKPPPFAGMMLGAIVLALCVLGCAAALKALSAGQEICQDEVLISSQIPSGTPVATVASDVAVACNLADELLPNVEQVVAGVEAAQADAGTAPIYVPSPMVRIARARKAAAP